MFWTRGFLLYLKVIDTNNKFTKYKFYEIEKYCKELITDDSKRCELDVF